MEKNHKAFLAYLFGWISGLIVLISSQDKDLRFHGMQSILFCITYIIIGWILLPVSAVLAFFTFGLSILIVPIYSLIIFIVWIVLLVKAYKGEKPKLPIIGNLAERFSK